MEKINKILDKLNNIPTYENKYRYRQHKLEKLDKILKKYMIEKYGKGVTNDDICIDDFKTLMINAIQNDHTEICINKAKLPSTLYLDGCNDDDIKKYINDYIKLPKIDGISYMMYSTKYEYNYDDCESKYIYIINPYKESDLSLVDYYGFNNIFETYSKYQNLGNQILKKYYEEKEKVIEEHQQKYINNDMKNI